MAKTHVHANPTHVNPHPHEAVPAPAKTVPEKSASEILTDKTTDEVKAAQEANSKRVWDGIMGKDAPKE